MPRVLSLLITYVMENKVAQVLNRRGFFMLAPTVTSLAPWTRSVERCCRHVRIVPPEGQREKRRVPERAHEASSLAPGLPRRPLRTKLADLHPRRRRISV